MPGLEFAKEIESTGLAPQPMGQFLASVEPLTIAERRTIVDQALRLFEETYVHSQQKQAMYAVSPVQRLKLLRYRLEIVNERSFHEEMISTFMSVHDLHTNYVLPSPYNQSTALLPFEIREFFNGDTVIYVVWRVVQGFQHPTFKPGVSVTHLNGVPIARAVELNARREAGSNADANHARGLERLTLRPLMMSLPPDEEWADVRYITAEGAATEQRFGWLVVTQPSQDTGMSPVTSAAAPVEKWMLAQGVDIQTQAMNEVKKHLFDQKQVRIEASVLSSLRTRSIKSMGGPDFNTMSEMPQVFQFEVKKTAHGDRAYIRILTFNAQDPQAFVAEFIRILKLLPQNGLILDVRGNGGGNILAGEMLLQTLSPIPVEPERFHFITTPRMIQLVNSVPQWFARWAPSMNRALLTGAMFSQGLPFEDPAEYNRIGRQYFGKVVLLTDAFCYSATDAFSAGFQDHGIGPVLGNHASTGAGGANVFDWQLITNLFSSFSTDQAFQLLPKGAALRVAIRRATRVGKNAGEPLEDLGVEPDHLHRPTLNDLLDGDRDLFDRAGELTM